MAHLIKLEDYISRYQYDLHRYPSQFTRMKKERWYYLKAEWEQAQLDSVSKELQESNESDERVSIISKVMSRMKGWKSRHEELRELSESADQQLRGVSIERLKRLFYNELFESQLRWASSSLMEESIMHPRYKEDKWLRYFTQQFPNNYFLMYKPTFFIKKARIELDILLLSPTELICLTVLEGQELSVFEASTDRFWIEYIEKTRKKRISPLLSLSRMNSVIKPLLVEAQMQFPVRSVVLSPKSLIDHKVQGIKAEIIDKRRFEVWQEKQKKHPSPLKHDQLKVAQLLLSHCYTDSFQREDEQNLTSDT